MDLHEFTVDKMYFDESSGGEIEALLDQASRGYETGTAEFPLLKAYLLASDNLSVLVALYRYYYFQHQYQDALHVADLALDAVANKLGLCAAWPEVNLEMLGYSMMKSMTLVRFYLMCVKGAGYLKLRMGKLDEGIEMLEKVAELDAQDRLGARALLATAEGYRSNNPTVLHAAL